MPKVYKDGVYLTLNDEEYEAIYGKTSEHEVQLPSAEERLSALEAAMLAMMGGAGHV